MNTDDIRHAYRMDHQVYESPGAARDAILELCDEVDKLRAVAEEFVDIHRVFPGSPMGVETKRRFAASFEELLGKISTPVGEIPQNQEGESD